MLFTGSHQQTHAFTQRNQRLELPTKLKDNIRKVWVIASASVEHGLSWTITSGNINSKKFLQIFPILNRLYPKKSTLCIMTGLIMHTAKKLETNLINIKCHMQLQVLVTGQSAVLLKIYLRWLGLNTRKDDWQCLLKAKK